MYNESLEKYKHFFKVISYVKNGSIIKKALLVDIKPLFIVMASLFLLSCEKYDGNDSHPGNGDADCRLVIRAMVSESEDKVGTSSPINIYVFDKDGTCVATSTITNANEPLGLALPAGSYMVHAIAGASADDYELPAKEEATPDYVIRLKENSRNGDLMAGENSIVLSEKEENTLTLSLKRKVMLLECVTMKNIPEEVTGVSVTISPLYENITLDGKFAGTNGYKSITLHKSPGNNKTWENKDKTYLLEATGPATVKVALTTNEGTKSYSYSSQDEFLANYKINIVGTYTNRNFDIEGTITGEEWSGTKNIEFELKDDDTKPGDDKPSTGGTPAEGTIYKGAYVLKCLKAGNNTTLTLMSLNYKDALVFDEGKQTSIMAAVNSGIAEISSTELTGWRLPSYDEIKYVYDNLAKIKADLKSLGQKTIFDDCYYFLDDSGKVKGLYVTNGNTTENLKSGKSTLNLRAFTTATIAE